MRDTERPPIPDHKAAMDSPNFMDYDEHRSRTKIAFTQQARQYLARDIATATAVGAILGIVVWVRGDRMWLYDVCSRSCQLAGVYLPDEVPQLYPDDCPDEFSACCCTLREMVFSTDQSPEAQQLRDKLIARGVTPPPAG